MREGGGRGRGEEEEKGEEKGCRVLKCQFHPYLVAAELRNFSFLVMGLNTGILMSNPSR